jgi:tetratricopeptide (TPR) repeat protein
MYRPVVSLAYLLEYRLWGRTPLGFHLVNLLLHAACVMLVFRWLLRRLEDAFDAPVVPALLGALVFALHPSRVESVAWISGCTDLWMMLFILLGLECWDRFRGAWSLLGASAAFSVALLCKEVAIGVPLLLLIETWWRPVVPDKAAVRRAVLVGSGVVAVLAARLALVPLSGTHLFARGVPDFFERISASIGGFVRLAIVPWPASTQASYLASVATGERPVYPAASIALGAAVVAGLVALLALTRRRPALRPWLADLSWFLVFLGPVLNIIPFNGYVAERYLYAPGLGLAALAARAAAHATSLSETRRPFALLAGLGLIVAFTVGSLKHAGHFTSSEALWTYEHQRDPENLVAISNLIDLRVADRRWDEAQALALDWFRLMPAPEDKGSIFGRWLKIELDRVSEADASRRAQVEAAYEHIAANEPLPPPDDALYAQVPEAGRRWLRRSRLFHYQRALAASMALNHPLARRLFDDLAQDPSMREGTRRALIIELLASGDLDEAQRRLDEANQAHMALDADRLTQLLKYLQGLRTQKLSPDAAQAAAAQAFASVRERTLARLMIDKALLASPDSPDLLILLANMDIDENRFDDARRLVEKLRVARPNEAERWKVALESIHSAEQAWRLAQQ